MNIKIETEHLSLRLLTENDLDNLEQLNTDPDVRAFFPDGIQNRAQTEKRMLELINNYKEHNLPGFIISEKESNAFLGRCGFSLLENNEVEVGYLLHKNYWGKGYATEALNALLNWAKKNISHQYIIAFAPTQHVASQRVMEKCGMALYKTDIAHGVECKFYKIKNTPIKERSCNTMTRNMIIRESAMADKAAFIQAMQRSQALHSPWVVSPQTEEKFHEYI